MVFLCSPLLFIINIQSLVNQKTIVEVAPNEIKTIMFWSIIPNCYFHFAKQYKTQHEDELFWFETHNSSMRSKKLEMDASKWNEIHDC